MQVITVYFQLNELRTRSTGKLSVPFPFKSPFTYNLIVKSRSNTTILVKKGTVK